MLREFVYPRRCPVCEEIVLPKGNKICVLCKDKLEYLKEPLCKKCGKPILSKEAEYCYDCTKKKFHFVQGIALLSYNDALKESIARFKFHGKREYADFYVEEMIAGLKKEILRISPDALIPIPIHSSKRRIRGYNQAELLAKGLGKEVQIPVINQLLVRNKKTLPQKELNDKERLKNLEQAFAINIEFPAQAKGLKRLMLVDDIYTTGSTIETCTKVLLAHGFQEIYFISLCIGKGY